MRVIAGIYRSRILKEIKNEFTRPTTDRNKETVFNVLGQFFSGGTAIDMFSGTGSLGIEAISRGIDKCYLIDKNQIAIDTIRYNVNNLKINNAVIYQGSYETFLLKNPNIKFDLVLLDPPYPICEVIDSILVYLDQHNHLEPDALVLCETEKTKTPVVPNCYEVYRTVVQASSKFTFLQYRGEQK